MKRQVARISILQSSKIVTALCALLGLLYSAFGLPAVLFGDEPLYDFGVNYIFVPAQLAIIVFIGFVIVAALYNLLASILGGIEYEVTEVSQ